MGYLIVWKMMLVFVGYRYTKHSGRQKVINCEYIDLERQLPACRKQQDGQHARTQPNIGNSRLCKQNMDLTTNDCLQSSKMLTFGAVPNYISAKRYSCFAFVVINKLHRYSNVANIREYDKWTFSNLWNDIEEKTNVFRNDLCVCKVWTAACASPIVASSLWYMCMYECDWM